jgi:hypothetical protein
MVDRLIGKSRPDCLSPFPHLANIARGSRGGHNPRRDSTKAHWKGKVGNFVSAEFGWWLGRSVETDKKRKQLVVTQRFYVALPLPSE